MDLTIILAIVGLGVTIIIGGWQIWLARKQIKISNKPTKTDNPIEGKSTTIIQSDNQSIALGNIEIEGNLSGNLQIGNTYNIVEEKKNSQMASTRVNKYREKPKAKDIYDEIEKLPILQKEQVRNSYIGLKVRWRATIIEIFAKKDNFVELMMRESGKHPYIYCTVNLLEYPEIRIVKDGHGIWVNGEIGEIRGTDFSLMNPSIELD